MSGTVFGISSHGAIDAGEKQWNPTREEGTDLAAEQPALQFSDQRQERMRQLAVVFIEMFRVRKRTASEEAA
jgi:hypothetical protein